MDDADYDVLYLQQSFGCAQLLLISIITTWIIRRSVDKEAILAKVRESYGKPLPKSKWQQTLEQAQKMQEEQLKQQRRRR